MIDLETLRDRVVGRVLPAGTYRVAPYQAWLHADVVDSPPLPDGIAHPMWLFNAALSGLGITIEEIFALGEVTMDDGPMGGEVALAVNRCLRIGEEVTVTGTITDVVRKHGGRGTFDLMTAHMEVVAADGDVVGSVDNVYILPRWG